MFRKHFFHGLTSGIMAALAAIIYSRIHYFATQTDFSLVVNFRTIVSFNMFACLTISIAWYFITRVPKKGKIVAFHILVSIISFAAVIIPISVSLPLSVSNPELFPGLAVPMVFFPALSWFTFRPIFYPDGLA